MSESDPQPQVVEEVPAEGASSNAEEEPVSNEQSQEEQNQKNNKGKKGKKNKSGNKGGNKGGNKKGKDKGKAKASVKLELQNPEFIEHRLKMWDELQARYEKELAEKEKTPIKVSLPNGDVVEGKAWETTPYDIAAGIAQGLANSSVAARVNGKVQDLHRVLEEDCTIELLKFDDEDGKDTFWHSSAHILGHALEEVYGCHLVIGPPVEEGFYYDAYMPDGMTVSEEHFDTIQARCKAVIKGKHPFQRLEVSKAEALEMFQHNEFKVRIITDKIGDDDVTSIYRCGNLIDLCRGPHVPHTGKVKEFWVRDNSSAYWLGNADNEVLQRVYGVAFPDKDNMRMCKKRYEEAAKRNHRNIGRQQELFFFNTDFSAGSPFFLPHGARIYNKLLDVMKEQYRLRGFTEVVSPNMFDADLWKISGHWDNYKDDMFLFEVEKKDFGMKPMNCPGHCLIFKHRQRSYRELPLRLAEFGVLHRNELSGALTGLTRVRRFVQDDAHIFCRPDQVEEEVMGALDFFRFIYTEVFDFKYTMAVSTRPEKKFIGEIEQWDQAEKDLASALEKAGFDFTYNPGDGAFYGPKIDIEISDALGRKHQCATIQLDFNLPERFDLKYSSEQGSERPYIVHRAVYGSFERFIAILCEHLAGKWPFWLSPRQACIIPVTDKENDYAFEVQSMLAKEGYFVDVDSTGNKMQKKVREAQLMQYNYMLVVGPKEIEAQTVNVRIRDQEDERGAISIPGLLDEWKELCDKYD